MKTIQIKTLFILVVLLIGTSTTKQTHAVSWAGIRNRAVTITGNGVKQLGKSVWSLLRKYPVETIIGTVLIYKLSQLLLTELKKIKNHCYLLQAARNGNKYRVKVGLILGIDVNEKREYLETTALMIAAKHNHPEIVELLLKNGAYVNERDATWEKKTTLTIATENNHPEIVALLLQYGADVDKGERRDRNVDETALMIATKNNRPEIVALLLQYGAHVDEQSLMIAVKQRNLEIVRILVDAEVVSNIGIGKALIKATTLGYLEIVKSIVNRRANISIQDINEALILAAESGHLEIVKFLANNGANIDEQDKDGKTALIHAIEGRNFRVATFLINRRADVNKQTNNGKTALIKAASKGHSEIVELLLKHNADANKQNNRGRTALILAATNGHSEIVEFLANNGANIDEQDEDSWTTLEEASRRDHLEIVKFFVNSKAINMQLISKAFRVASWHGHLKIVEFLANNGADIDEQYGDDKTALIYAIEKGYLEIIKFLVSRKADISKQDIGKALRLAARFGHLEIVEFFANNGADIDEQDEDGKTALIHAIEKGHLEISKFLIIKKANVNKQANNGTTALIETASRGYLEITELLLKHKADITHENNDDESALFCALNAKKRNSLEIANLLTAQIKKKFVKKMISRIMKEEISELPDDLAQLIVKFTPIVIPNLEENDEERRKQMLDNLFNFPITIRFHNNEERIRREEQICLRIANSRSLGRQVSDTFWSTESAYHHQHHSPSSQPNPCSVLVPVSVPVFSS